MSKMLSITQDGMMLSSEPLHVSDFINMTLAAQLNMFNDLVARAKNPKDKEQMKASLYDMYNAGASAFLKAFAPEYELRPDLTEQAIMEKENEILERKVKELEAKPDAVIDMGNYKKNKDENLLPLDSLDENGKPKKQVHKK